MGFSGVFIDDNEGENGYAKLMSTRGELDIEYEAPGRVSGHAKSVFDAKTDLLVLDFRLDEQGELDPNERYKGSVFAQQVRDLATGNPKQDFPIVLISSEDKIRAQFNPDLTSHDLFDKVYSKEEVNDRIKQVQVELISLCAGYERLRSVGDAFDLMELTALSSDEDYVLDHQELYLAVRRAAAPHQLASIFLCQLIGRTGLLLDIDEACARLGVAHDAADYVANYLDDNGVSYKGLFSTGWQRFWAHRLDGLAQEIFGQRSTGIPANERAEKLSEVLGHEVKPATSPWNKRDDELIAFACACCSKGTEMRHSVGVFETNLPAFSVRRRICWRCVYTDHYQEQQPSLEIDASDKDLVEIIKKSEIPG